MSQVVGVDGLKFSNYFEAHLALLSKSPVPGEVRQAITDVADTAYGCKLWFESQGLQATAADIVAMARLVLEREALLVAKRDAE